jgi:hypothetical protein
MSADPHDQGSWMFCRRTIPRADLVLEHVGTYIYIEKEREKVSFNSISLDFVRNTSGVCLRYLLAKELRTFEVP